MAEKTYTYHGPLSAVTLAPDAKHPDGRDVQLVPGSTVTLPDDNAYVRSLVARNCLEPAPEPVAATPASPAAEAKPVTAATAETKTTPAAAPGTSGTAANGTGA